MIKNNEEIKLKLEKIKKRSEEVRAKAGEEGKYN